MSDGATVGATVLPPFDHDLGLQQGDKICLGSGSEYGPTVESNKGVYTVQSYDAETKIVTLSAGIQTARLEGDYVAIASSSILINRLSGTTAFLSSQFPEKLEIKGTNNKLYWINTINNYFQTFENLPGRGKEYTFKKCVGTNRGIVYGALDTLIDSCVHPGSGSYSIAEGLYSGKVTNSIGLHGASLFDSANAEVTNTVVQNANQYGSDYKIAKNNVFKNIKMFRLIAGTVFKNSIISASNLFYNSENGLFIDCEFLNNCFNSIRGKCLNCTFPEDFSKDVLDNSPAWSLESYNHDKIDGNYKAWMRGGKIETALDGSTILPGRLILSCESADYPVFRDFPVLLPAHRTSTWQALTKKSFTGGSVKIELIDPANDPLIDPSAQPLATYSLPDQADTNLPLKLGYKSDKAMQAIIRISAQNASGTVEIDTRLIENRVQHGQ